MNQLVLIDEFQLNAQRLQAIVDAALKCPFCGGSCLSINSWETEELGEIDAIECDNCLAGAPVTSWQNRRSSL